MSSTHSANPLACAAGLATLQALLDDGLLEASVALGEEFQAGLQAIQARFPRHIPYGLGKGLVAALHFADPVGDVPGLLCSRICEEALRRGLLLVHTGRESIKLVECAGNEALTRTWHSVAPVDLLFVYDLVAVRNGSTGYLALQPIVAQHVRLLTYLRNGDRAAAEKELKAQFTAPNRSIWRPGAWRCWVGKRNKVGGALLQTDAVISVEFQRRPPSRSRRGIFCLVTPKKPQYVTAIAHR